MEADTGIATPIADLSSRTSGPSSGSGLVSEVILLRVGLAAAGGLLIYLSSIMVFSAPLSRLPGDVLTLVASGALGLILMIASGLRRPPSALRWLILLAYLADLLVRVSVWSQTSAGRDLVTIDPALYSDMAGELLQRGENPYTWDLSGAFGLYRTSQEASTPRLNAANEQLFPYPSLSFLLAAPFQILDMPGSLLLAVVAHVAVLLLLFLAAPVAIQPLVLLPIVVGFNFPLMTGIGVTDIVWAALLVWMVLVWKRPTLRAVLFGLAAAFKQGPWLVAPFLFLRIWREEEGGNPWASMKRFVLVSGATFVLFNGPFMVWDFRAWFRGVTVPLGDDLVFYSQGGLATLSHLSLVSLPKSYYLNATFAVLALLLFVYWRHYQTLRNAYWIMPGLFMWLSYRSLVSYWTYWIFPMLATLIRPGPARETSWAQPSWRLTLGIAGSVLGLLVVTGILLSLIPAPIEARPMLPVETAGGRVNSLEVLVTNHGDRAVTPRFAVQQRAATMNPLPWTIHRGPLTVPPGGSAVYHIATGRADRSFSVFQGVELVVTDAGGDYALRGAAPIGPEPSFLWPDAIPNPSYHYWDQARTAPLSWELVTDPVGSASLLPSNGDGPATLMLTLDAQSAGVNRVSLRSQVVLPLKPFGVWVYWDPPASAASSVAYGLEIDDGRHQLWFLFGSQGNAELLGDEAYVVTLDVPLRTWNLQQIDVPAAYAEAGWRLPEPSPARYRGLDIDLRLVHVSLFLAARGPAGKLQAHFGPVVQEDYCVAPRTLMAETLDDPVSYYLRLVELYSRDRNTIRASEARQRAIQYSGRSLPLLNGGDDR